MDRRHSSRTVLQPKIGYISTFSRIKDIFNTLILFGGMAYAIYVFYKNVIKSFIFGKKEAKSAEERLDELCIKVESELKLIHKEIDEIKENISKNCQTQLIKPEIQALQHDLEKIRGLLLNKKQFASPSLSTIPSIPQWQLDARRAVESEDKNEDANSGSGSSEAENVTKNSDSSLEIM